MTTSAAPSPSDQALYEQAACGLLAANREGVIVRANATFCQWLGYASEDIVGSLRVEALLTVGARVFHQTHCIPLLQMQGSVAEVQVDLLHRDRTRIPVLMNIVRHKRDGAIFDEYAILVATDRRSYERELLSARKHAEASLDARRGAEAQLQELNVALSHADQRKDEFLATLAHELRNPLAPMRNVLEVLKLQAGTATAGTREDDGPAQSGLLDVLERQLRHMTHLVDDLMEVSRITQGRMDLRCVPVDLGEIVQTAVADVRGMFETAAHALDVVLPPSPVTVHADPTRLAQIVMNLLTNAAKYTPRGGQISLRAWRDGEQAVIAVRDNGIGIPAESLESIFKMFSQLAPALERSQGGLGIGLALVHGLVALHGGSIAASSAGVGKGSEFVVRLPVLEVAVADAAESEDGRGGTAAETSMTVAAACRILVVDDNVDAAETMMTLFGMLGYDARLAHDSTLR